MPAREESVDEASPNGPGHAKTDPAESGHPDETATSGHSAETTDDEPASVRPGVLVVDRDSSDDVAVVVNTPGIPAHEWEAHGGVTVAEDNPAYPADDPIVAVVFAEDLAREYPYSGPKPLPLAEPHERSVSHYSFPHSRLRVIGEASPHEVWLDKLRPNPYHARSFDVDAGQDSDGER